MTVDTKIRAAADPIIGRKIEDRYVVERKLGEGGVGTVYLASDTKVMDRKVVIKVLLDDWLTRIDVLRKFEHEKEALARLDHPSIVSILDSGVTDEGKPFFVMPYVCGRTLQEVMEEDGIPDWNTAADIIEGVAGALSAAHSKGILHRDVKPANIMIADLPDGKLRVLLIDFGIARVFESRVSPITDVSRPLGTVLYVAPEQLEGNKLQTPAADIYSFGIVCYEMLTGQLPFEPNSMFDMVRLQLAGPKFLPSHVRPGLSANVDKAVAMALALSPADRYQEASVFGAALCSELRRLHERAEAGERPTEEITQPRIVAAELPELPPASADAGKFTLLYPLATGQKAEPSPARRRLWNKRAAIASAATAVLLFLVAASVIGWMAYRNRATLGFFPTKSDKASGPSDPQSGEPSTHRLKFYLMAEESRNGKPTGNVYRSDGTEAFKTGSSIALGISCSTGGHIYVFNESVSETAGTFGSGASVTGGLAGPATAADKLPRGETKNTNPFREARSNPFYLLFPANAKQAGETQIPGNKQLQTDFLDFKGQPAKELLWIVWTKERVPEIENALLAVLPSGMLSDPAAAEQLRNFLQKNLRPAADVARDPADTTFTISSTGDEIVYRMELEHR
jgi:hypothetical protein